MNWLKRDRRELRPSGSSSVPPAAGSRPVPLALARNPQPHPSTFDPAALQRTLAVGMTYELGIDSFFGASHSMRPSGERHSHSFRIQASFVTDSVDENGMICGFREVSNLLEAEAKRYANRYLNEIEPFVLVQPTGENLATVVYRNLVTALDEQMPGGPQLVAVTLWENPTSYVRVGSGAAA